MKKNNITIILGNGLLTFGLDKFIEFVPYGHVMSVDLVAAFAGLMANKFILPNVGVISNLMLLIGKYSLVGLVLMIPVTYVMIFIWQLILRYCTGSFDCNNAHFFTFIKKKDVKELSSTIIQVLLKF